MTHMPALPAFSRLAVRRRAVRTGCAMALALALVANPGTVGAQSFQGAGNVVLGEAFVGGEGNSTTVFVNSAQTIINWELPSAPVAGNPPVVFQPEGTTADFAGGSGVNSFTVLNRILPVDAVGGAPISRPAQLNGTVTSPSNGSIWFYSPSGLVIGSTATFNVGNLVLTSNDIDTTDGLLGTNGEIRFRGAASSLAPVEIQAGAIINAGLGQGSYLAIVAPRIVQAGTISVDGHVALVAAEQADIRVNIGLLDIEVTQGTTDPNGIIHTGTTGGPASGASDDRQVLSLIAIPKNTALTMMLSGSIGYTPAASAADEGSAVVLSAGHGDNLSNAELAQNLGSISIGNSQFTSAVTALATNAIDIAPIGGTTEFQQGGSLSAFRSVSAIAGEGESIIGGNLGFAVKQGTTGGSAIIRAEAGGQITAGSLILTTSGSGEASFPQAGDGLAATSGSITFEAAGGSINADHIILSASAYGLDGPLIGGSSRGGSITASVSGGGSITTADFSALAEARGGYGQQNGGDGVGGTISLLDQGGTLDLGQVMLQANGSGGRGNEQTGNAEGGSVFIDITSGTKNWSGLIVEAGATGGEGFSYEGLAGNAAGRADAIRLHVRSGAVLNIADSANLSADADADVNGASNTGVGGGITVLVDGGGTLRVSDTLNISASAFVSDEAQFYNPQTSPTLTGGTVNILANGGTIEAQAFQASANASGIGSTEMSGTVTGGTAIIGAANGGTIRTFAGPNSNPGSISIEANAYGSYGAAPSDATGGSATLFASDGTLDVDGIVRVSANAEVASLSSDFGSGIGFTAQGGLASVELRAGTAGTASLNATGISVVADGNAISPEPLAGNGGSGTGGTAQLSVAAGTLTTGTVTIQADGLGAPSRGQDTSTPLRSGDGFGGAANLVTTGGTITITESLQLLARGMGAGGTTSFSGQIPPLSGNGTGGTVSAQLSGGSVTTQALVLDASGIGGIGNDDFSGMPASPGTDGGIGMGGSAQLGMAAGTTARLTAGSVLVTADGVGGAGGQLEAGGTGNGGAGTAGSAGFNLADGSFTLGATTVRADGVGGAGEIGGNGVGGTASFVLNDSLAGAAPRSIATLSLLGRGIAGISNSGPAATETAGQTRLVANVGSPGAAITIASDFIAEATGAIAPAGDGFAANLGGGAFNVGGNTAITTSRDVSMSITTGGALATQGALTIVTPRSLTTTGLISAAEGAAITADLGISMSDLQAGGATLLSAVAGPIVISNDLSSAGLVSLVGTAVNVRSLGALTLDDVGTTGDFAIETGGDLLAGTVAVTGNVALTSTGGLVQTAGRVSGTDITIAAANGVSANADLIATGALQVQTGGMLRVGGRAVGTNITAASGDIAFGPNGSIGQRGTTRSITLLNSNAASPTFIGGAAQSGGYSLDAAEATRLVADDSISLGLSPNAGTTAADLVIGDLALSYGTSGNIGTGGVLKINAPGRILVNGAVALATSSNADRFAIDPTRIDINTDTGSIIMQNAGGGLMGQLELVGGTIAVASGATLAAIANLSNPADINAALDAAPANPNAAGYLQAGSILLNAENAIYIANTGTSTANADRRGFTAGSLGIITGSAATHVSINGVLIDASGASITGQDTLSLVNVNGAPATARGRFTRFSTINGCAMGAQSCNAPLTSDTIKTKSDIEVPLDPDGNTPQFTYVLEIDEREPDDQQPLVDEPVTGVGNDDLWNGACGSNPGACPQGGNSQ